MKALDLFCGAGGAGVGINRAGYQVTGVDIAPQPSYPFEFIQADAIEYLLDNWWKYDFIWASPPCQKFSFSTPNNVRDTYEDYIEEIRSILEYVNSNFHFVPYIIENVVGAPLLDPIMLCGTMMHKEALSSLCMLKVFRHRLFESNVFIKAPGPCKHSGHEAKKRRNDNGDFFTVAGHWVGTREEWGSAMGIDWMKTKKELAESIPPVYSEFLCRQILQL